MFIHLADIFIQSEVQISICSYETSFSETKLLGILFANMFQIWDVVEAFMTFQKKFLFDFLTLLDSFSTQITS